MKLEIEWEGNWDAFEELKAKLENSAAMHAEIGLSVESLVISHIRTELLPKGNRLGAPSTGFWQKAIASVVGTSDASGATVSIPARGVALQYYGGTVFPSGRISEITGKPITKLTIPVNILAYGKSVGDFPKGEIVHLPKTNTLYRKVGDSFEAMWVLLSSVTISAHPEILPPETETLQAARDALEDYLATSLN